MAGPSEPITAAQAERSLPQDEAKETAQTNVDRAKKIADVLAHFDDDEEPIREAKPIREEVESELKDFSMDFKLSSLSSYPQPRQIYRRRGKEPQSQEPVPPPTDCEGEGPPISASSTGTSPEPSTEPSDIEDASVALDTLEKSLKDDPDLDPEDPEVCRLVREMKARIVRETQITGCANVNANLVKLETLNVRLELMRIDLRLERARVSRCLPEDEGHVESEPGKSPNKDDGPMNVSPTPETQKDIPSSDVQSDTLSTEAQTDAPEPPRKSKPRFRDRDDARDFFNDVFSKDDQERLLRREWNRP